VFAGKADDLADQGYEAFNSGKYELAAEYFLAAIEKEKDHVESNTGLLKLYLLVGDYKQAIDIASSLAVRNTATGEMLALGGDASASTGKYSKALEFYKKSIAADKSSVHSLLGTGTTLSLLGEKKEGKEYHQKALAAYKSKSDNSAQQMVYAASACAELNRYTEANSILGEALKKDPENLDALTLRGSLFLQKYDYPYAKELFERALEINPKHTGSLIGLAWTYGNIGELGADRFSKARSFVRKALRVNRSNVEANIYFAYSELMDCDYDRSGSYLKKALKTNPKSIDALSITAAVHLILGDKDAYEKTQKKAYELEGAKAEFLNGAASVLQRKFRYEEALNLALEALKHDENYWPAYAVAGLNMLRLGKEKEAKKYLEKSYENDPFNVWTFNSLQLLMHMKDNFKEKKTPHFIIKMNGAEFDMMVPYIEKAAESSYKVLSEKYKFEPEQPILIELFQKHKYFAARTVGLPGISASGACFGPLVTMDSPSARRTGTYNWAKTLHHELAHVFTLLRSKNRISRWFGEGLSVYEEKCAHLHWGRNMERAFIDALGRDSVVPIAKLERTFNKPRSNTEVLLAYYQSSLIVEFMAEKYGFDKVLAVLDAYGEGKPQKEIFKECLEADISQLDADFLEWARKRFGKFKVAARITASDMDNLRDEVEFGAGDASSHARLARSYLRDKKLLDCEAAIKRAFKLEKSNPEALVAQAEFDVHQGFNSSAKKNFLKALAAGLEKTYDVHLILAQYYLSEKKKEEAIEYLKKAIADFPNDITPSSPYRRLYTIYKEMEQEEQAIAQLEKLVSLSDKDFQARWLLSDRYLEEEKYSEALRTLRHVNDLHPLIPGLHERLGDALRGEDEIDEAMTEYNMALVIGGPDQARAYSGLAQCYLDKDDAKQAQEYARKALQIDPNDWLAREVLELLGKWSE
jgi:tetratricopeptide (TPR) repeat protein